MIQLNDIQRKLAERLLIMVHKRERDVTYGDLGKYAGMNPRNVGSHIGEISKLCHALGLPLLSAKVVNQNTRLPGEGFYPLYDILGIPKNGKSDIELFHSEKQAILDCNEWYKLEDYLGLDVGLSKPYSTKLLDARNPQPYQRSVFVLNKCFGKDFAGWQQGAYFFNVDDVDYSVWFPKLAVNGKAASSSGWINTISPDGNVIEEYGSEDKFFPIDHYSFVFAKQGQEPYYFRGVFKPDLQRSTGDHHYYYKAADVADLRSSVPIIQSVSDEDHVDDDLISDLREDDISVPVSSFEYQGMPLPVPEPQHMEGRIVYPRNRQRVLNALAHAGYVCEIDPNHLTFKRKRSGLPYTEPHHLIPMSQQFRFDVSLDVEENIVSLCSTCHNHIHYGQDAHVLIKQLFNQRKDLLRSVGIIISEDELLSYYR